MSVRINVVHSTVGDAARDLAALPPRIARDSITTVRDGANIGSQLAAANARQTSGSHGKHHPRAYSAELLAPGMGAGGFTYAAEYGADAGKLQGGMSFEEGSRNQRPHRPLGRTLPMVRPAFHREFSDKIDDWFW